MTTNRYVVHADPKYSRKWIIRIQDGPNFFRMTPEGEEDRNSAVTFEGVLDAINRGVWAEIDQEEADQIIAGWHSSSTYAQYLEVREKLGYHPDDAMIEKVWAGCEPEAQRDMLRQLKEALEHVTALPDRYGVDAW